MANGMPLFATTSTQRTFGPKGPRGGKGTLTGTVTSSSPGLAGLLSTGLFLWLGYLMLAGVIGFSKQLQWMILIGVGIWWISKK